MEKQQYIDRAEHTLYKVYNRFPVVFDHGEGVKLYDTDGQEYLDFGAGIAVMGLGYSCDEVKTQSKSRWRSFRTSPTCFTMSRPSMPVRSFWQCPRWIRYFTNSGTEAIEGALKSRSAMFTIKAWHRITRSLP